MIPTVLQTNGRADNSIRARGLCKSFNQNRTKALDGMDFDADAGDMTAIVGPSGSGKSTLLYAISGLMDLDAGRVSICGEQPVTRSQWTGLRQRCIGLVFQDDWLLPTLTAAQNIELPMIGVVHDRGARQERVQDLLSRVNASAFAERMPAGLSGGERQRIAVARGLANRPSVLLADEPTGELDSANSKSIMQLLKTLHDQEKLTVLIVTHDPVVAGACDRCFAVHDGVGHYVDQRMTGAET